MRAGVVLDDGDRLGAQRVGRDRRRRESPECTPASSTCSITPPIRTSPVASRMASTSTSVASSRKRSMSTGRSAESPPSLPSVPKPASSAMARRRLVVVVDDLHGPAAEHVATAARAPGSRRARRRRAPRRRWWRCRRRAAGSRAGRTARSSARGPRRGRSTSGVVPRTRPSGSVPAQLERRLPAERDDHAHQLPAACSASMTLSTSSA